MSTEPTATWRFVYFGLLVTGKGEAQFACQFLRALATTGHCAFKVLRRVTQLRPRNSSKKHRHKGRGGGLPSRDEEIGLTARRWLENRPDHYVLLIDDLEQDWAERHRDVYQRYRDAFDTILGPGSALAHRASIHFLVMMLEAYYFADSKAVNRVLETELTDPADDVETLRHPKNELKRIARHFDEIEHGRQIVELIDLEHVLANPTACASLRTLVAWCMHAMGEPAGERFQLASGALHRITGPQLHDLI